MSGMSPGRCRKLLDYNTTVSSGSIDGHKNALTVAQRWLWSFQFSDLNLEFDGFRMHTFDSAQSMDVTMVTVQVMEQPVLDYSVSLGILKILCPPPPKNGFRL